MKLKLNEQGLIPAIIQNAKNKNVLMLGYMSQEAYDQTVNTGKVTFFSRSKNRLWQKGEESGNLLEVVSIENDCDNDALLVLVNPIGPTCHNGTETCWGDVKQGTLSYLESTIAERKSASKESSYVAGLFDEGINKIAQKVGEEAVETIIEAVGGKDELFVEEAADLFFHYLILLQAKDCNLQKVLDKLENRRKD